MCFPSQWDGYYSYKYLSTTDMILSTQETETALYLHEIYSHIRVMGYLYRLCSSKLL